MFGTLLGFLSFPRFTVPFREGSCVWYIIRYSFPRFTVPLRGGFRVWYLIRYSPRLYLHRRPLGVNIRPTPPAQYVGVYSTMVAHQDGIV